MSIVVNSVDEVATLKSKLLERDQTIIQWQERHQALDRHWQEVLTDKLARQRSELRKKIAHELTETRLSITGSEPDLDMALDRIARIERILLSQVH